MRWLIARFIYIYAISPMCRTLGENMPTTDITHEAYEPCDACGPNVRAHWCFRKDPRHLHFCNHHHDTVTSAKPGAETDWLWYPITEDALTRMFSTKERDKP